MYAPVPRRRSACLDRPWACVCMYAWFDDGLRTRLRAVISCSFAHCLVGRSGLRRRGAAQHCRRKGPQWLRWMMWVPSRPLTHYPRPRHLNRDKLTCTYTRTHSCTHSRSDLVSRPICKIALSHLDSGSAERIWRSMRRIRRGDMERESRKRTLTGTHLLASV